jgi:hypothetical protein
MNAAAADAFSVASLCERGFFRAPDFSGLSM